MDRAGDCSIQHSGATVGCTRMYTEGRKGEKNGEQFLRYFDLHPQEPITVEKLIWIFQELKKIPNGIFFKSDAQLKFERASRDMSQQELAVLEKFLKSNRLYHGNDEKTYSNAYQLVVYHSPRPWNPSILANWTLPYIQGTSKEPLYWKAAGADPDKKYGQHSGSDSHFAPRTESNQSFSHRVLNRSAEIPRPVSSKAMDDFQWNRMANSLVGDRHSDTAAIQRAVKAAGGGEAGYIAGVAEQKRIRMERERGR